MSKCRTRGKTFPEAARPTCRQVSPSQSNETPHLITAWPRSSTSAQVRIPSLTIPFEWLSNAKRPACRQSGRFLDGGKSSFPLSSVLGTCRKLSDMLGQRSGMQFLSSLPVVGGCCSPRHAFLSLICSYTLASMPIVSHWACRTLSPLIGWSCQVQGVLSEMLSVTLVLLRMC